MDKNLGEGLSARCVMIPPLKCGDSEKNKKENRVSKIINKPKNEKYEFDMYYRELLLAKKIMDESVKRHNKEYSENRFAGIEDACYFKSNKNKDRDLKSCKLNKDDQYIVLFSNNAGCRIKEVEEGDTISFKSKENKLYHGIVKTVNKDKSVTVHVEKEKKQYKIERKNIINACGALNDNKLLKAFFNSLPDVRMRFRYMLESMAFLNSIGIAHLDIKRDNIICDSNGVSRIIDFGASLILFNDTSTYFFDRLCTSMKEANLKKLSYELKAGLLEKIAVHTPVYVAPEFELCSSIFIENELTVDVVKKNIKEKCEIEVTPEHEKLIQNILISEEEKIKFVLEMFCGDEKKYPDLMKCDVYSLGVVFKKIVSDSKISDKNLDDLVLQMNSPLYKTRPSFKECLAHKFFN